MTEGSLTRPFDLTGKRGRGGMVGSALGCSNA
jgi:hypothetical protein